MILTHAHSDHVGHRRRASAPTRRPRSTSTRPTPRWRAPGKVHQRDGSLFPYLRRPATWKLFLVGGKTGAARTPNVEEVTTFSEPVDLDVPGRPRIVPTPGHSPGHVCFHLPDRGVLFAGDALCTYNPLTGRRGPQVMPRAFAPDALQVQASLEAVERIDAGVMLPGHGEPWTDGPAAAVARAREVGLT